MNARIQVPDLRIDTAGQTPGDWLGNVSGRKGRIPDIIRCNWIIIDVDEQRIGAVTRGVDAYQDIIAAGRRDIKTINRSAAGGGIERFDALGNGASTSREG